MSLILEALKKSERERRLGEAPSLGTPVGGVRRRRSRLPLLVGLIALALAIGWWLRREPPLETPVAPATPPPATPAAAAPNATVDAAAPTDGGNGYIAPRAQGNAATRLPRSKVAPDANAGVDPALREKLASGELVVANPALLKPGQAATVKESAPMAPGALPQEQAVPVSPPVAPAGASESASPTFTPPVAVEPSGAGAAPAPVAAKPAEPTQAAPPATPPAAAATPAATGPQLLWALPYAQRRGIPELKLSMHVYAAEPAQRFVIVNGNRQVEGDTFEGLKLIEIRNDGIVLEREGLRFVYPRGGR